MEPGVNTVALVSCVSAKLPYAAPAGDLYTSALFTKARDYALNNADAWHILSAEHGLLSPLTIVSPYEKTLNNMPVCERRAWAETVTAQLLPVLKAGDTALFLAGMKYREGLKSALLARGVEVVVPMRGMGIGQQLGWLTHQNSK